MNISGLLVKVFVYVNDVGVNISKMPFFHLCVVPLKPKK